MENSNLLDKYKKYDYLNQDKQNPLIKILVSYVKPSFLFKSDILTPIHLGRAIEEESSKDGIINESDIKWLRENCIGDDDFKGNISAYNRRVGFLTGTYYAWKNYDKLGNPEYFGSFGYRKLFIPEVLIDLKDYDIIIPEIRNLSVRSNKLNFIDYHTFNLFLAAVKNMKKIHPENIREFLNYMDLHKGYYHELYIMKKEIFFRFCEWIFSLLQSCLEDKNCKKVFDFTPQKLSGQNIQYQNDKRDIAFIMEIYTGFYLYMLKNDKEIHSKECAVFEPELAGEKIKLCSNLINLIRKNLKNTEKIK